MAKFTEEKRLSLKFFGKDWKDSHIVFRGFTVAEFRAMLKTKLSSKEPAEILDASMKTIKEHFVRGVGYDNETKKLIKLTKPMLDEMPSSFVEKAIVFLVEGTGKTAD